MKLNIIIKKVVAIVLILTLGLPFSSKAANEYEFLQSKLNQTLDEAKDWQNDGHENIISIGLSNGKDDTIYNTVRFDSETDNLYLLFTFLDIKASEYVLKIFVDYEETNFFINQIEYNKYFFEAKETDSFFVQLSFPKNKIDWTKTHILTAAIFQDPQLHEGNFNLNINPSFSVDFTLMPTENNTAQLQNIYYFYQPTTLLNIPFNGIMLNTDYNLTDNNQVFFPPSSMDVKCGEKVKLAYRVSGGSPYVKDILFLLLVDWKQTDINNIPYMYIQNNYPKVSCEYIEFEAPNVSGQYEIVALMSSFPFQLRNKLNCDLNSVSTRFTLNVI